MLGRDPLAQSDLLCLEVMKAWGGGRIKMNIKQFLKPPLVPIEQQFHPYIIPIT